MTVASGERFWRLDRPECDSYQDAYINGELEHPYGLPGVCCDVCGATWGGTRFLAQECPPTLRGHKNLRERRPISRSEHADLQREVMAALGMNGEPFVALQPGDDFQPCFLDVPSRPRADVLWSTLGSLVVADRIRDLLLEACDKEIAVCPVTPRKIGRRSASLLPPMPSTGDPADMIREAPLLSDASAVGGYSEILILKNSGFPPGGTPVCVCPGCKRPETGPDREFRMTPEMWNGQAIFFLATTLYIVVTDSLKRALERVHPTNVVFRPI